MARLRLWMAVGLGGLCLALLLVQMNPWLRYGLEVTAAVMALIQLAAL